jgi:hypothetical protein
MKRFVSTSCCILLFAAFSVAQEAPERFAVFEDQVKPSMDVQYRDALKKLKTACEENEINSFSWRSVVFDDNSYHHLVPIKNMGDLDKNMMADLEGKMGKEALSSIFTQLGECTDAQTSAVVSMQKEMSYLEPAEGENFRDILFWHVLPGKEMEADDLMMEWKKMYESKQAPSGFISYKIDFGREPGYVIVSWGKDEGDHATRAMKTRELLGEEGNQLWNKTMMITKKYKSHRAWLLPDYSFNSMTVTAQK